MGKDKVVRDDSVLLDKVYINLVDISEEIKKDPCNAKLIDAFDSLLGTYFEAEAENL